MSTPLKPCSAAVMSAIGMPGSAGRPSSPSVMLRQPGNASIGEIVRGPVAVRPRVAERVDRAIDDARDCAARTCRVADAEPLARRPAETTRRRRRPSRASATAARDCARSFRFEHDALLAAVQVAEEHRRRPVGEPDPAARIAVGRLDLDDLRAVVGERQRQVRPRQEHREIDDAQARRASCGGASRPAEQRVVVGAERRRTASSSARSPFDLDRAREQRRSCCSGCGTV